MSVHYLDMIPVAPYDQVSRAPLLQISLLKGPFQDSVANLNDAPPASIRSILIPDYHLFAKECTRILRSRATMRLN